MFNGGLSLGNGDGTFQPLVSIAGLNAGALVADFNGDGKPDLAGTYRNYASLLLGHGDGTFQLPMSWGAGLGTDSFVTADVNRDGRPDLVTANLGTADVAVLIARCNGR